MGVSVEEGTISCWLKREGDVVTVDEPLLSVSTDKVDTEILSPANGVLLRIMAAAGQTVPVGSLVAAVGPAGAQPPTATLAGASAASVANGAGGADGTPLVSPLVARMLAEHGLALASIAGTGRNGRVTKHDVLAAVAQTAARAPAPPQPAAAAPTAVAAAPPAPAAPPTSLVGDGELGEPMSAMRRSIAEHMRRSLDTAAHAMSAIEVDMSRVAGAREATKREAAANGGRIPTYLAYVAVATASSLGAYPWVNGELRGDQIVTRPTVNLGIAVEVDDGKGLLVPVIRRAETLNVQGMAAAVADLAQRARSRRIGADDLQGGTFTITNPGGFGIVGGAPIINQPQAAILGTYAVVDRPWVVLDQAGGKTLGIRPIMNLSLTYDHRLVDGAYAGRFLRDLKTRLESWEG